MLGIFLFLSYTDFNYMSLRCVKKSNHLNLSFVILQLVLQKKSKCHFKSGTT